MKLDIFETLKAIDNKQYDYYSKLPDDLKKQFNSYMLLRWSYGTNEDRHLIDINDLVNRFCFNFYYHPELVYLLLTSASNGSTKHYKWKGVKKKKSFPMRTQVIQQVYNYSEREANMYVNYYTKDEFVELAEKLGWEKEEINKLKKEFSK